MQVAKANQIITDIDRLVVRLERNHQYVLRLARKLNSYKYEPRNYDCFIRLRDLRTGFDALAKDQMQLFDAMQHRNLNYADSEKQLHSLMHRFRQLESDMAAYVLDSQQC